MSVVPSGCGHGCRELSGALGYTRKGGPGLAGVDALFVSGTLLLSHSEWLSLTHSLEGRCHRGPSGPNTICSFVLWAVASNTSVSLGCVPFACITKTLFPKPRLVVSRVWRPLVVIE